MVVMLMVVMIVLLVRVILVWLKMMVKNCNC